MAPKEAVVYVDPALPSTDGSNRQASKMPRDLHVRKTPWGWGECPLEQSNKDRSLIPYPKKIQNNTNPVESPTACVDSSIVLKPPQGVLSVEATTPIFLMGTSRPRETLVGGF